MTLVKQDFYLNHKQFRLCLLDRPNKDASELEGGGDSIIYSHIKTLRVVLAPILLLRIKTHTDTNTHGDSRGTSCQTNQNPEKEFLGDRKPGWGRGRGEDRGGAMGEGVRGQRTGVV
jgi:hypothetical protein